MPLQGTICCQTGQPRSFAECEQECRAGMCKHSLPILVNMRKNTERRQGIGISASTLSSCPRQVILQARNDFYEDPEDYYARWQGTVGHYAVEMDGPYDGVVQEVRFYREITVEGIAFEVSGQPDWIEPEIGLIADHKFTTHKPREPKQDHISQLNVYRWLAEGGYTRGVVEEFVDYNRSGMPEYKEESYLSHTGDEHNPLPHDFSVSNLRIYYYHGPSKDKSRHTEFNIPLWDTNDVEAYIRSKLHPHARYIKTGSLVGVGVSGPENQWRVNYCPLRHDCNTGQCCLAPMPFATRMP